MSWQLGAFVVLALGLGGGFAWYERTRPDARIVALVGTLAAFAALGRIAFAALPNVKPTGDIVLMAGFALGGAPGYVVGSVAALSSNFFFGQGPWTPWQMLGWGLTGVFGAGLARVTRGRIGRWPLACVCFVVGFGFTALQDFSTWLNYSDHSLGQLGVYIGGGVGFDLIYATGCFGFALAFGPALLSALRRFRRRLHVSWLTVPTGGAALLLLLVLAVPLAGHLTVARAAVTPLAATRATATPLAYLSSAQNADGGFGPARGQPSTPLYTGWAVMAGAGGTRATAYLARTLKQDTDPGSLERTVLALTSAGVDPTDFGGEDLVTRLEHEIGRNGSVEDQCNLTAFTILALRSAQVTPPAHSIAWLARQQDRDGGFNYATAGASSDVDDTGAVIEALAGSGRTRVIRRAVDFIRSQQNRDGGFPAGGGEASNAQSTAFAVQGLIAAGVRPESLRRAGSRTPIQYLRSLIQPNGAVDYGKSQRQTPVWVTAQVQLALAGRIL